MNLLPTLPSKNGVSKNLFRTLCVGVLATVAVSGMSMDLTQKAHDKIVYNQQQKNTVNFVDTAINYYKENGAKKSFNAFDNNKQFKQGDHYIFIMDKKGNILSHGYNLEKGDNIDKMKTMTGQSIADMMYRVASNKNGGWAVVYWEAPNTHERQLKTVYAKILPGTDYIIGSGYYSMGH